MKCAVYLCILATLALAVPSAVCDRAEEQELTLRRNRRTVQFLVNHFVHFFGLSGGGAGGGTKKIEPKQDNVFALPLTNILKASAGKFSGVSAPKHKQPSSAEREPTLQHDLPQWIDRPQKQSNPYSEAFEADSLEPTRVSLLSTTREPEETTTTSTTTTETPTTTTTQEPAPIAPTDPAEPEASELPTTLEPEEPATSAPETEDAPQEGTTEESAAIAPADVNSLSDAGGSLSARNDVRDNTFQPTPIPLVSYQHYVQPAIWPAGPAAGFQHTFPTQQYFGNNVFIPAQNPYPLASPFQVQTLPAAPAVHGQGYPSSQPVYDNRLYYPTGADSQPKSHSRVKLHDNHYDLVTYHDDTEPAASNYQLQSFGNYRARHY
uniref:DUF4794 domain-containing protein n=1 Tax=Anopheles christyi TaxID=43041 RepID=A0A182K2T2_9DIPT